jgi:hypothetical protein
MTSLGMIIQATVFVGTGVLSTILAQILIYAGAGDSWTALLPLSNYLGMALAALIPDAWVGAAARAPAAAGGAAAGCGGSDDASKAPRPARGGCGALAALLDAPREAAPAGAAAAAPGTVSVAVPVYVACAIGLDIAGFWLHVQGIRYVGSALFQVIYASVTVFAALGSWAAHTRAGARALVASGVGYYVAPPEAGAGGGAAVNRHTLNAQQLAGIAIVLGGLAAAAAASEAPARGPHDHGAAAGAGAGARDAAYGLACSVACALCYGVAYTLAELLMSVPAPPRAQAVASRVGGGICLLLGSYAAVAVAPRAREVAAHVAAAGLLSPAAVVGGYALMVLSAVAHSITYFQLLGSAGAVATGVMQAARAVGVFAVSAAAFCLPAGAGAARGALAPMLHAAQCATPARTAAAALVCGGILVFSVGKAAKAAA